MTSQPDDRGPLRLRAGDEFKHLEVIAARLSQQVIEKQMMKAQADEFHAKARAESTGTQTVVAESGSTAVPASTVSKASNVMPLKRSTERP